ncbi:MAG: autotransporter-associated beta strand repeat-containing protein [Planctomycetia bacterium]|nr:autotransporter-associated beta strand repeat-containing protein [Planctomycetia bacterium]
MEPLEQRQLLSVTWNGLGGNNLWSTGANWVGGQVPGAGEDLIFSGATRTSTQNDLAYAFDSLAFTANNFSISGNGVLLDGDISVNSGVVGTSIPAGVTFGDEADVNVGYGSNMTIGGPVANPDGLMIHVSSGSSMTVSGGISGVGELTLDLGYGSSITIGGGIADSSDVTMNVPSGSHMIIGGGISDIGGLTATEGSGSSLAISGGVSVEGSISLTEGAGSALAIDGGIAATGVLTLTEGSGATATISDDVSGLSGITWSVGSGASATLDGNVSGDGGLTKTGTGTLTLSGHNTFTGTTTITAGTLSVETSDALSGSTLDYDTAGGSLDIGDLTTLVLGGLNGDKNLALTNGSAKAVAITAGGNGQDTTHSGVLSGSGSLTKAGEGTLTLSAANTYSGDTIVNAGTLRLDETGSITSNTTVNGGQIELDVDAEITGDLTVGASGTVTFDGGGTVTGDAAIEGLLDIDSGTAHVDGKVFLQGGFSADPVTLVEGQGMITSGLVVQRLVTLDGGMLDLMGGAIAVDPYSGDGTILSGTLRNVGEILLYGFTPDYPVGLDKWGDGTLTLTGTNTYSFRTRIFAGTLRLGDGTTNGSVLGNITNNGILEFANGSDQTFSGIVSGTGAVIKSGEDTLTLLGAQTYSGGTTISDGTLQLGHAATDGSVVGNVVNDGILEFASASDQTFAGLISGTGSLIKSGAGTLTLPSANTYEGDTAIRCGTLRLGNAGSLGTSTMDYDGDGFGGQIDFGGLTAVTLGGLKGSQDLVLGNDADQAVVLSVGGNNADTTYAGVLGGSGSLVKVGTGTLTLAGDNTYAGETTIQGGTLAVGNGGATGSLGIGTVIDNGSLVFNTSDAQRAFVVGSGSLTLSGSGTFTLDCPGVPTVTINDPNDLLIPGGVSAVTAQTVLSGMPMTVTATVADPWSECQAVAFYHDLNDNGVVDGGDALLGNGTNAGGYWSTTVSTVGWGPSDDRVIAEATFPANTEHPPASAAGETSMNVLADWAILSPTDQAGYAEFGDGFSTVWTAEAVGGRYREMSGTDPDAYVTYTFTGLSPGNYEIWEHYLAGSQYSNSVPIEVYDGDVATGALQQTFSLNETTLNWSNWEVDGYDWNWSGGYFYSNTGTVTVRVACDGELTQAPAIRLIAGPILESSNCPTSNDPINLATGQIEACNCGDAVQGTTYDNRHAGTLGDTGNGMLDERARLTGQGMLLAATVPGSRRDGRGGRGSGGSGGSGGGCCGDRCDIQYVFIEPVRNYAPQYGTKATLVDMTTYLKMTEPNGTIHHFGYPDNTGPFSIGPWMSTEYPDGETATVTLWANDAGQTSATYGSGYTKMSKIEYEAPSADDPYAAEVFTYYGVLHDNAGLRASVTYSNWNPDTSSLVDDYKIEYEYYVSGSNGLLNDLKTATTSHYDPGTSTWSDGDTTYFRYYTGPTYEGEDFVGFAHGLKRKLLPEAYAKAEAYATGLSTTVDALTDGQIAPFTCFYYKYDANQRVTYEEVYGELRTTTYDYTEGANDQNARTDLNLWIRKTVETRPDLTTYTAYTNYLSEELLTDLEDTSGNHWYTYRQYDANGNVTLDAESSAIDDYEENAITVGQLDVTGTDFGTSGLVHTYTYSTTDTAGETTAGTVSTYLESSGVAEGLSGTTVTTAEYTYYKHTANNQTVYHLAQQTTYINTDETGAITTSYSAPLWYSGRVQINEEVLNLPEIDDVTQNGSGTADHTHRWYDEDGNLNWTIDQAGRVNYYEYDPDTGRLDYMIEDVDSGHGLSPPAGVSWSLPSDGLHLRTDYTYDLSGRLVQTLGPQHTDDEGTLVRTASWTVYDDADHRTVSAGGYAWYDTSVPQWKYTLVNPVAITVTNRDGDLTQRIEAIAQTTALSTTDPRATIAAETFDQDEYTAWTTYHYSHKQLVATRVYHAIPTTNGDAGSSGTNYDQTAYGYDANGRPEWTQTPDGTITWNVLDARGLVTRTWVGTDAVPTSDYNSDSVIDVGDFRDWLVDHPTATTSSATLAGTSMFLVSASIYDGGDDGGDGLLTESRAYFDSGATNYYATEYYYDWRDRLTDTRGPDGVVTRYVYDNLGRTTYVYTYADGDDDYFTYTSGVITGTNLETAELRAEAQYVYDSLGRVCRSRIWEVDQQDAQYPGTKHDYLATHNWYDARGQIIKTSDGNGLFQKYAYDGLGRLVASFTCFDTDEASYPADYTEADDVTGDTVIEQTVYGYDAAGQTVATAAFERLPGDTSTVGALDATNSYATARVAWYDGAGRMTATADFGREDVNSGVTHYVFHATSGSDAGGNYSAGDLIDVDRDGIPDVAEAARTANDIETLVEDANSEAGVDFNLSLTEYNAAGLAYRSVDNLGRIDETQYDAAGRVVRTIQNYANGTVAETDTDQDVTVYYGYSAGRLVTMMAYNAKGTGGGIEPQVTAYLYESDINASWQTAAVYPDSTDALAQNLSTAAYTITTDNGDHVSTDYDRLGRVTTTTDQRGVEHEYVFDATTGRLTDDCVTSLGSSGIVDGAIRRITTTYDDLGRVQSVSGHDDPDPGEGNVVNEVQYVYNGWGQVAREYQEHDGPVDGSTLYVDYHYADGAVSTVAKYVRLDEVTYPNGRQVHYDYGATGAIDDIMSRLATIGDGSTVLASYKYLGAGRIVVEDYENIDVKLDCSANNFAALDRFGRVVDQLWLDYGANPDVALDEYRYGYDEAGNRISRDNEKEGTLDEDYLYDALDRLSEWKLNNVSQKAWDNFDGLGNDLDTGTYNAANEMTPTGEGGDPYDAAGNMTTLESGDTAVYDAWNRLVKVLDGETVLQQNEYDGTNRRIQVFTEFDGSTPERVVDDYHAGQQTIESDVTADGNRDGGYQTIWSPRYIDSAILRDTLNTAGTAIVAAERVFYLADANYNVTALVKYSQVTSDWEVAERYTYTPYGEVTYRNAATWVAVGSSANNNTTLYTGRELDLLTTLYYYRARYYDAHLERFIGRDPIGYQGGINLYAYVGDRPLVRTDPSGMVPFLPWPYTPPRPSSCPCTQAEVNADTAGKKACRDAALKNADKAYLDLNKWYMVEDDKISKEYEENLAACAKLDSWAVGPCIALTKVAFEASDKGLMGEYGFWWAQVGATLGLDLSACEVGRPCAGKKAGDEKYEF